MPFKSAADKATYMSRYRQTYTSPYSRRRAYVRECKNVPCTDCKTVYPHYVMQFDHIGDDKTAEINYLIRSGSLQALKDEITKCEVVCANCHAERTWQRSNGSTHW